MDAAVNYLAGLQGTGQATGQDFSNPTLEIVCFGPLRWTRPLLRVEKSSRQEWLPDRNVSLKISEVIVEVAYRSGMALLLS